MDTAYLLDWVNLLLRWLHVVTGIAWIGVSFYFVWLDNSLKPPKDKDLQDKGVSGELWAVHGGGFYNPQKYMVAPADLPDELHWFKWESYTTWLSGFSLLAFLYYLNAGTYMVDKSVLDLTPAQAVMISLGFLIGGWLIYDFICRSLIEASDAALGGIIYVLLVIASYALTHIFSGRAALLHVGAMIATIMSANVLMVIIPGQRKVVAQMRAGEPVNPEYGKRAKQRSVHNNYFTLPVLFAMLSNHYAFTYSSPHAWLLMAMVLAAGVLMRLYFNLEHKGKNYWGIWALVAALALAGAWLVAPGGKPHAAAGPGGAAPQAVTLADIRPVIEQKCAVCHAAQPSFAGFAAAPKGVLLQTEAQIRQNAKSLYEQAVRLKAMPIGNVTGLTDAERERIAAWYEGGMK
jgi:uncharacterized membrane protein